MVMDDWIAASNNGFRCRGRHRGLPKILAEKARKLLEGLPG